MNVFVSYPIDKAEDLDFVHAFMEEVFNLSSSDITNPMLFFMPEYAYKTMGLVKSVKQSVDLIVEVNAQALNMSDVVVMFYFRGQETWGCPVELFLSKSLGKRVILLIVEQDEKVVARSGCLPTYVQYVLASNPKNTSFVVHGKQDAGLLMKRIIQ